MLEHVDTCGSPGSGHVLEHVDPCGSSWVVYLVVEVVLITLSNARTLPQGLVERADGGLCDLRPDRVRSRRAVRGLSGIEVGVAATRCRALAVAGGWRRDSKGPI